MATQTTNYHLSKPEATDNFKDFMQSYNGNMDIIDNNMGGGGGNADVVHLTQAQYDALPDTKLTDNKIYLIEDGGGGGGGSYTAGDGIDITSDVISVDTDFTEASTRQNIASGDSLSTIFGKIKKFFTDLKTVAFSGDYADLSNTPTIPGDIEDLDNVNITAVSNGQILKYNSQTQKWENANETGGGGGYETIEDADGTALTQRDTVQFGGYLKTADDNVNLKTVVSDEPTEITWDAWQNLTTAQKEGTKWLIKDVPSAEGSVEADLLNPLWTNPNDNVSFSAQNITLSSADYDYLLIIARLLEGAPSEVSAIVKKGGSIPLDHSYYSNGVRVRRRVLVYNTDTSYSVGDATDQGGTYNQCLIPMAIYGIKQKITVSFDALAESVSTLASKCILSGGSSVESALTDLPEITQDGVRARVKNGILFLSTDSITLSSTGSWINITTLPVGYRPISNAYMVGIAPARNNEVCAFFINPAGQLSVKSSYKYGFVFSGAFPTS